VADAVRPDLAFRDAQLDLRASLASLLGSPIERGASIPVVETVDERSRGSYVERRIRYPSPCGSSVSAYLLLPCTHASTGAVVVFHQHNGEWHLGKSEVVGIAGRPLQAFGARLAERGIIVLAPDSIGFEDRRRGGVGTDPRPDDATLHLMEYTHRVVAGELLMTAVLADAAAGLSVVLGLERVDPVRVGVAGHSFGGHVALFHAALDERVRFACVSGAAGSYRGRIAAGTGIGIEQAIPSILDVADFGEIAGLIAPRPLHLVSATSDRFASDAAAVEASARETYRAFQGTDALTHLRVEGGHPLDEARARDIVEWLAQYASL
jgi:dienelactone hydrolase